MFDGLDPGCTPMFVGKEAWPSFAERVQPHIAKIAEGSHGRYWPEDINLNIMLGIFFLWVAIDGPDIACVLLTQVIEYPRAKAMRCIAVVGHRPRRWMHLMHNVELASKQHFGCTHMEAFHQPRHALLLRTGGWETTHCLSEKPL
jgi:hypothetical protein